MDTWIHDRYMIDTWIRGYMDTWIYWSYDQSLIISEAVYTAQYTVLVYSISIQSTYIYNTGYSRIVYTAPYTVLVYSISIQFTYI